MQTILLMIGLEGEFYRFMCVRLTYANGDVGQNNFLFRIFLLLLHAEIKKKLSAGENELS